MLGLLELTEQPPNGSLFLRDSELVKLSALFEQLNLTEVAAHPIDDPEARFLRAEILNQVPEPDTLALLILGCFQSQLAPDAIFSNLVYYLRVKILVELIKRV